MGMIRGTFGFFGKHAFNVRRWMAYDQMRDSTRDVVKAGKAVFKGPKVHSPETFEEALGRMNLTEVDIQERYSHCRSVLYFAGSIGLALIVYSIYLLIIGTPMGAILAFAVGSMSGVMAFKNHFWMFQIKNRKLGCSFSEWCSGKIKK